MKFLLVLLVVVGVLWLILKRSGKGNAAPGDAARGAAPKPPPEVVGAMVACARCGVLFPQDEAVRDSERRVYCSSAHLAAGPQ